MCLNLHCVNIGKMAQQKTVASILHFASMCVCESIQLLFTVRIRSEQCAPEKGSSVQGGRGSGGGGWLGGWVLRPCPCMRGCKRLVLVGPAFTQGPKGSRGSSGSRGLKTSERGRKHRDRRGETELARDGSSMAGRQTAEEL